MPTSAPEVCVVGSLNVDVVVRAPRRPDSGETLEGTSYETFLGGKGFNQAVAAARSGATTAMVGKVGNDEFGSQLRRALADDGIEAGAVSVDATAGTGVAAILVDAAGENSIVVVPRANGAMTVADVTAASDAIGAARVVLLQLELPLPVVLAAARLGHEAGAAVVLNPAPAPDRAALDGFAGVLDVIVPNEGEAARLGTDLPARSVVVTRGARGVTVGPVVIEAHVTNCVDTVGAGDAFCGAMAAALARGADLVEAARYGNAAGAVAVTKPGASPSMPFRQEIEALL